MAYTGFDVELYLARVKRKFDQMNRGWQITNQNYYAEGNGAVPKTVYVYDVGTVGGEVYDGSSLTIGKPDGDSNPSMSIDQYYVAHFKLDVLDEFFSNVDMRAAYADRAGVKLAEHADNYILGLGSDALAANKFVPSDISGYTGDTIDSGSEMLSVLREAKIRLDEQNIPNDGTRYFVAPPRVAGLLSEEFKVKDTGLGDSALVTGLVGRAEGFNILSSTGVPTLNSATDWGAVYGHPDAVTFAPYILEPQMDKEADTLATVFKHPIFYGAKVFHPEAFGLVTIEMPS